MKAEYTITEYSELLMQLMKKVLAEPGLKDDLRAAQELFTGKAALDKSNANSFNEWYLLERDCPLLGAPPAVAFAPSDTQKDDIWHCLLDSFFGLFHVSSLEGQANTAILECLWSARQVRVTTLPVGVDVGTLIPARVAQSSSESHLLLPAANFIIAPDLLESLASDLRDIRGEQPRARLSQLEWQRLFTSHQLSQAEAVGETFEEVLAQALHGQDQITIEDVIALIDKAGAQEALNQIAFDADIDIEPLRAAFALIGGSEEKNASVSEDIEDDAAQAISDFLGKDSSGSNLEQAFGDLEQQLGLEAGATGLLSEQSEATGIDTLPGVEMWLRSYLFDCEVGGIAVSDEAGKEIERFLNYCAETVGEEEIDPHQLPASTVLAYMMGAENLEDLQLKIAHLDSFVHWLCHEQDSPLESITPLSGDETSQWLIRLMTCNSKLASSGVKATSLVDIAGLTPLSTLDEDGGTALISDFPEDFAALLEVGDKLMGSWTAGTFVASAWMPKRLLPSKE